MHVTKRKVADVLKERILESMLLNKRICSGNVNDENIQLNGKSFKFLILLQFYFYLLKKKSGFFVVL